VESSDEHTATSSSLLRAGGRVGVLIVREYAPELLADGMTVGGDVIAACGDAGLEIEMAASLVCQLPPSISSTLPPA
jgi:hypothetical protein